MTNESKYIVHIYGNLALQTAAFAIAAVSREIVNVWTNGASDNAPNRTILHYPIEENGVRRLVCIEVTMNDLSLRINAFYADASEPVQLVDYATPRRRRLKKVGGQQASLFDVGMDERVE